MQQIIWLDRMLRDATVSAVCQDTLTAGHDAVKSCVGGLAGGDSTLCMSLSCKCATLLSRVLNHWIDWKGQVTLSFQLHMGSYRRCHDNECVHEGHVSLHSLGECAPASSVLCTIGLAERACDVVRRMFSRYRQHCRNVFATAELLLYTVLVCSWLVLTFHLSVAMSILSSRHLLLMQ